MEQIIINSYSLLCLDSTDMQSIWNTISSVITDATSLSVPTLQPNQSQYPVWFIVTSDIKWSVYVHEEEHINRHQLPTINLASNRLKSTFKRGKSNYESSLISNYAFGATSIICHYICFHSVFNKESQLTPDYNDSEQLYNSLCSLTITEADVFEVLSQLGTSKAIGIDGIGPKILKHCATSLSRPLCHLFYLVYPLDLYSKSGKTHIIIPIHKANDHSLVNNYHPISLLSNTSKVLERLIFVTFNLSYSIWLYPR